MIGLEGLNSYVQAGFCEVSRSFYYTLLTCIVEMSARYHVYADIPSCRLLCGRYTRCRVLSCQQAVFSVRWANESQRHASENNASPGFTV